MSPDRAEDMMHDGPRSNQLLTSSMYHAISNFLGPHGPFLPKKLPAFKPPYELYAPYWSSTTERIATKNLHKEDLALPDTSSRSLAESTQSISWSD